MWMPPNTVCFHVIIFLHAYTNFDVYDHTLPKKKVDSNLTHTMGSKKISQQAIFPSLFV